jgi:integrase
MGERRVNGPAPASGGLVPMQKQGYSANGRKLVKTGTPGVFKRGGRYVVIFRDPSGMPRKRAAATMKEARALKASLKTDVSRGEYRDTSRATFSEFAPEWIDTYAGRTGKGVEQHTRESYRASLEADAIPFFGRTPLAAITPQHVKRFAAHVASRGVSASTVKRTLAPVRCLLADAFEDGLIRSNPAAGLRVAVPVADRSQGEDDEGEAKALSDAELARFLAALPERWRLLFEFLAESGLRIGEAIELRRRDLDLDARLVHVRRRFYRGKVGLPKGRKTRRVRISVRMALLLAEHVAELEPDALVFTGERGARVDPGNLARRMLKPAAVEAGLGRWIEAKGERHAESWVHLHTLRHTAASRLFRLGWNVKQVQGQLGHYAASFTLDTYVHVMPEDLPEIPDLAAVREIRRVA